MSSIERMLFFLSPCGERADVSGSERGVRGVLVPLEVSASWSQDEYPCSERWGVVRRHRGRVALLRSHCYSRFAHSFMCAHHDSGVKTTCANPYFQFDVTFQRKYGSMTHMPKSPGLKLIATILLVANAGLKAAEHLPVAPIATQPPCPQWNGQESIADYAKKVNLPPVQNIDLGNGVKIETVLIPAGKFTMGTPEHEKPIVGQTILGISGGILLLLVLYILARAWNKRKQPLASNPEKRVGFRPQFSLGYLLLMTFVASFCSMGGVRWYEALKYEDNPRAHPAGSVTLRKAHEVTLTKTFYMSKYQVTQEQYQQVMGTNPSDFKGNNNPVGNVTWDDAQEFCKRVTKRMMASVPDPSLCRLPSEAEWEYACRAGTQTNYYSGDMEDDLKRVAWYSANSTNTPHPVGQKEANAFGLYDMHGNVWQWCQDWFSAYSPTPVIDPQGPAQGDGHPLRGGSWLDGPRACRSDFRIAADPDLRCSVFGFRVVAPARRTP